MEQVVSDATDVLEGVAALRPAIALWKERPAYWARVLGVAPTSIEALIEHGEEVCAAADFVLRGDAQ